MPFETILLTISVLLLLSILASKISTRLSLPALVLFLLIGMLAGSEGIGGIYFDDANAAQSIGVIALVFILFSGGLDTNFAAVQPVLRRGLVLATLGVFVTAMIVAFFAAALLDFPPALAFLLGAILASTDAAAVFSIFRTQHIGLKGDIVPTLEFESGSNDPMAIFLTLGAIELINNPEMPLLNLLLIFVQQAVLGGVLGLAAGWLAGRLINNLRLEANGLYPVLVIALVLLTYSAVALLGGSGFLAVYILGLVLSTRNLVHRNSILRFHDSVAWLMQVVMFLVLGLLVFPSRLVPIAFTGIVISLVLIFVARPVSIFIGLVRSQFSVRDKLFISWVGLRGATPIVLATFPLLAGIPQADTIFNIVFFVVLTSVLLQGTAIVPVARLLGVAQPYVPKPRFPFERVEDVQLRSELVELPVPQHSAVSGRQIVELGLPVHTLIVLILRDQEILVPNGDTVLQGGDLLLVLAEQAALGQIRELLRPAPE